MRNLLKQIAVVGLSLGLFAAPQLLAKKAKIPVGMNDERQALHALNRLTFGPRPGDLQKVTAMGVEHWIDLQLHPERIDDHALEARLEGFRTLRMSTKEIAENFPNPQEINQVMNGRLAMPSDPALHAIYEVQVARFEERKERKQEMDANAAKTATTVSGAEAVDDPIGKPAAAESMEREERTRADFDAQQLTNLLPEARYNKILALPHDELLAFADSIRGGKEQYLLQGLSPSEKENLMALNNPMAVVESEVAQAKLIRAVYSERQLEEVISDFWFNHFNVFIGKGPERMVVTSYERDVIRPHALGKFEDLLVATAKSPAMLFYLDNWLSVGPNSLQARGIPRRENGMYGRRFPARANQGKRPSGLNENYGRELLELHTLSVNGGYSQRDVTEVAKVFTGWTIDKPVHGGGFKFEPRMHEPGAKFVLGHRIKEGGEDEGLQLLHRLATSPQTAHFISLKLAERFVADNPPPALVDRMAKTFLKKKGDIREVLSVLFHSPEFWDDSTYRAKVKTPLEFVASSLRAAGAEIDEALPLTRQLANMGMPLYGAQPPTGYPMKADTWVSSSALLNRMNFALALTNGRIRGVRVDAAEFSGDLADPLEILSMLENKLVAGGVSQQTHDSIVGQIVPEGNAARGVSGSDGGPQKPADLNLPRMTNTVTGLLLGSPEFQRR